MALCDLFVSIFDLFYPFDHTKFVSYYINYDYVCILTYVFVCWIFVLLGYRNS